MKKNYAFFLLCLVFLFSNCKKDNTLTKEIITQASVDITLDMAIKMAGMFKVPASIMAVPPNIKDSKGETIKLEAGINKPSGTMSAAITFKSKTVSDAYTLNNAEGQPSLHVINFTGGGFIVISTTKKEHPVLAYSDADSFPKEVTMRAHPVNNWLYSEHEKIKGLTQNKFHSRDSMAIRTEWMKYRSATVPSDLVSAAPGKQTNVTYCENGYYDRELRQCVTCPEGYTYDGVECVPPPPCSTEYTVGPLLQTNWGQGCGYNDYAPGNGNAGYCYHDPAGCVAVAIGQIMKYWNYGNVPLWSKTGVNGTTGFQSYNYSNMYYGASSETARLLRDIGTAVNMDYDESGSGANPNHETYFKQAGFNAEVHEGDYSAYDVLGSISYGRPVILTGRTYSFWPWGGDGHEWVADGLHAMPNTCYPSYWSGYYVTVHLNWGWGGYCNGWYLPGSWIPRDPNTGEELYRFLHDQTEVTNIHP